MTNNNVNLRHRAPATLADQGEPHAPQQIAHNEPERPLIGAQDNPNRAPGWINRIQRAWQQGTNAIRENGDALEREAVRVGPFAVYGAVATWGVEGIYHYDDKDYIPHRGPK